MPPQSRGSPPKEDELILPTPTGLQSKSTPNLPTLKSLRALATSDTNGTEQSSKHRATQLSPEIITSTPEGRSSLEGFSLDAPHGPPSFSHIASSDDEDTDVPSIPSRLAPRHQSRSHAHLAPLAFAPPFYNRPPTPLPPSPSLTSLLRPTFSGASSRPNTPDPSSDEGTPNTRTNGSTATGAQTPSSAAASTLFRAAKPPIPRASPKVPTYEYYGFTLYLSSSLAFIVYVLWSFLPSPFLHQFGIYYYPNRWWALAIPAWTVMLIVYIYVALASYNTGYLTLSMDNVECLVDEAASIAVVDAQGKIIRNDRPSWRSLSPDGKGSKRGGRGKPGGHSRQNSLGTGNDMPWRTLWNEGTDAVMDIPIGGVCEILYGQEDDTPKPADQTPR